MNFQCVHCGGTQVTTAEPIIMYFQGKRNEMKLQLTCHDEECNKGHALIIDYVSLSEIEEFLGLRLNSDDTWSSF